ncbi:MAG: type II secretion system protein [Armatimonadetes bacterium]|nr:type II secretion system protein [Armatimonadota bacterium]
MPRPLCKDRSGFTLLELIVVISILAVLLLMLTPYWARTIYRANLSSCISNEKNIATALQVYSTGDPDHFYPNSLPPLAPSYINQLPYCRTDSLRAGYGYEVNNSSESGYTLSCSGDHTLSKVPRPYPLNVFGRGVVLGP